MIDSHKQNFEGGSPLQSRRLQVSLLADDLTGACDSAVAFAMRGMKTEVALAQDSEPGNDVEVWGKSTNTRDASSQELAGLLRGEFSRLPCAETFFKKIDSVFRGNTFDEIAHTLRLRPDWPCVLAPAFPAAGRTSRNGVLRVIDVSGERQIPVVDEFGRRGLPMPIIPPGLAAAELERQLDRHWTEDSAAVFCDAETQDHLHAIVESARKVRQAARGSVLWIGTAGLAHALAANLTGCKDGQLRRSHNRRGRIVFFIGSNHPVTLAQVTALRAHAAAKERDAITIIKVLRGTTTAQQIRDAMTGLRAEDVGCLLMTGGDTAALVCDALGITSLRIENEFTPGLPMARARGGEFEGTTIILKSGGFGTGEVLCELAETFGPAGTAISANDASASDASAKSAASRAQGGEIL